jgi:hypothetical protein
MLRFTNESRESNGTKNKSKFCRNSITSVPERENLSAPKRERNMPKYKCTTQEIHKHTKERAKDIGALKHRTLYKRDQEDHNMR